MTRWWNERRLIVPPPARRDTALRAEKARDLQWRAIEVYEQRLAIVRELGDQRGEAFTSWNLGNLLAQKDEIARAVALIQVCVDYEQATGQPDAEADAAQVAELRE